MNNIFYIFFIFIIACSLNSNSKFWSKSKKIETDNEITKILFEDIRPNENEFNPTLKVSLPSKNIKNISHNLNNDGFTNQSIVGNNFSKYKFSKIENFSVFPGSELKLLKGLELGCSGIITATCNVTASLARKVYDDFFLNKQQTHNEKLCKVRKVFDQFNLISGLHTFLGKKDKIYKNLLPPLSLLNEKEEKKLLEDLGKLDFN